MSKRTLELEVNQDLTVTHSIQPDKVIILVLDGFQGKAKICEAVHHGSTIIETYKGKTSRINFEESELF